MKLTPWKKIRIVVRRFTAVMAFMAGNAAILTISIVGETLIRRLHIAGASQHITNFELFAPTVGVGIGVVGLLFSFYWIMITLLNSIADAKCGYLFKSEGDLYGYHYLGNW